MPDSQPSFVYQVMVGAVSAVLASTVLAVATYLSLRTRFNKAHRSAVTHIRRAETLQNQRLYEQAQAELQKSIELLSDRERSYLLAQAYLRLGDIGLDTADWDSAIQYLLLCRNESEKVKHGVSEVGIQIKLGRAYLGAAKFDDAFRSFEHARESLGHTENPLLAEVYLGLGEVETCRQREDQAIDYYLRAINVFENIHDESGEAKSRHAAGDLNMHLGNHAEAYNHYTLAIDLYRKLGDSATVMVLHNKLPNEAA